MEVVSLDTSVTVRFVPGFPERVIARRAVPPSVTEVVDPKATLVSLSIVFILNVAVRAPVEAAVMVTTSEVSLASSIAVRVTVWGVDQLVVVKVIVVGTVTEDVVLDARLTCASKGG
jgi:hypothetical protein